MSLFASLSMDGPARPNAPSPSNRRGKRRLATYAGIGIGLLVLAAVGGYAGLRTLNRSPHRVSLYEFDIADGMTARQIADRLQHDDLIRSARFFVAAARFMDFDRKIHAGTHWIDGSQTTVAILRQLLSGGLHIARLTVPEGSTVQDIGRLAAAAFHFPADSLDVLSTDSALVDDLAFPGAPSLEGFLFPDTYFFDQDVAPRTVVRTMAERFHEVFNDSLKARADSIGMTPLAVLTLASIIEKEAAVHEEQPIISQVFHKRLKLGYKLGSDPTVKYAMQRDPRRLSLHDIEIDSPYNTYKYAGLPPGPICNPGRGAIHAALYPANTDYLYFVANWDGTHTFTKSLREHRIAKVQSDRKYRAWMAAERRRKREEAKAREADSDRATVQSVP